VEAGTTDERGEPKATEPPTPRRRAASKKSLDGDQDASVSPDEPVARRRAAAKQPLGDGVAAATKPAARRRAAPKQAVEGEATVVAKPAARRRATSKVVDEAVETPAKPPARRRAAPRKAVDAAVEGAVGTVASEDAPKTARSRRAPAKGGPGGESKPAPRRRAVKTPTD
jgi:hypothetical protein